MKGFNDISIKTYDRTASDLYVDKPLTNVSIKFKNNKFIASEALSQMPVSEETGLIWKYGDESYAIKDLQRSDKSRSKQSTYNVDTDTTYRIINYALSDVVTQKMRKQQQTPMQVDTDTTEYLSDILDLNKEYLAASALFSTANFAGYTETLNNAAVRYQWDDYTNSNPIDDATYAIESKIEANSGATGDINLIVGRDVWVQLRNHPDILERIKYTQKGIITPAIVAEVMGVNNVLVGRARYNTANEGQTISLSAVWGKFALFYHKPARAGLKTAATAITVHGGRQVRKWKDPYLGNADVIEVEEAFQHKILSAKSGYLFSTAVA